MRRISSYDWFVGVLIAVTRFGFFDGTPDYFDATQYLWRTASPNLVEALSSGHAPYHPGYIFFSYIFYNGLKIVGIDKLEIAATLPAVVFGSLALWFFYRLAERLTGSTIAAVLAAVLAILAPYLWLGSISILVDSVMWAGFLGGLLAWHTFLTNSKSRYAALAGLGLGLAMFAHTQVGIWITPFAGFFIVFVPVKRYFGMALKSLIFLTPIALSLVFYIYLLLHAGHNDSAASALQYLLRGNSGDHGPFTLRAAIIMFGYQISFIGFGIGLLALFFTLMKNLRLGFTLLTWLLPGAILAPAYLYANLYGRAASLGAFPMFIAIGFMVSRLLNRQKYAYAGLAAFFAVGAQIVFLSLPVAFKMRFSRSPYDELRLKRSTSLVQTGVEITSNLAKTYNDYNRHFVVWEQSRQEIEKAVHEALAGNKPVYVGMDAVLFPYYKYDGSIWSPETDKPGHAGQHESMLGWLYQNFYIDPVFWSDRGYKSGEFSVQDSLSGDIASRLEQSLTKLPEDQSLIFGTVYAEGKPINGTVVDVYSKDQFVAGDRLLANDWLYNIYRRIRKVRDPIIWTLTDASGVAQVFVPTKEARNLDFYLTTGSQPFYSSQTVKFIKKDSLPIYWEQNESSGSLEKFQRQVAEFLNKSFIAVVKKEKNGLKWQIGEAKADVVFDNKIKFADLPRHVGRIVDGVVEASADDPEGLLSYGPWLELPSGNYQASFELAATGEVPIEVVASGSKVLASQKFDTKGSQTKVVLKWQNRDPVGGVEFRVSHGKGSLVRLKSIFLESF